MNDPPSTTGQTASVAVVCADHQDDVELDPDRWARLATDVLTELVGERNADRRDELTLTFVDASVMADLNAEHLGHEGPTDVLSFPLDIAWGAPPAVDPPTDGARCTGSPLRMLGDVVICPAMAADQAPSHAGTLDDELALLVVHGILHVLGHDHDDDESTMVMRAEERRLLIRHHWRGECPVGFRQEHP
ncbi:MAG: rRNA maturation RNase YbeY [Actinomycetota bacterium]|nr:rRNA maturation RNase YbeY [Actinomycetota bacterium]